MYITQQAIKKNKRFFLSFYFLSLNKNFFIYNNSEESKEIWRKEITSYWIQFIRLESLLPPPFNLIEDFLLYSKKICFCRNSKSDDKTNTRDDIEIGFVENTNKKQYRIKVLKRLVCRYKFRNYIK